MRKTKKMAALALTIAMAAGGMTSAYAVDEAPGVSDSTEVKSIETNNDGSVKGTEMLLTGTIKVTTLSVTIPTTVSFNVDMTKIPASEAGGDATKTVNVQVEQPSDSDYKITNNSASSVWVYVTGVTPTANGGDKVPKLTNKYEEVKKNDYNILFAIKDSAENSPKAGAYDGTIKTEPDEIGTADYWMTTGISSTNKYYLNSTTNGELIAADLAKDDKAGDNIMPLTIYAFTRKGWKAGDKFNVTPVFTVSVTDPTA